jgi:tetratricopeptide (TPR) repeat protein
MGRAAICRAALAAAIFGAAAPMQAFEVGEYVFPKTTPGAIKVGDEVVAQVKITDFLRIEKGEGGWLWVECRDLLAPNVEGKKGWIATTAVDSLDTQLHYFEGRGAESDNAGAYFLAGAVASLSDEEDHARQALGFFTKAIELDGKTSYYHQRRASTNVILGNYDAAIEDLEQAGRIDPTNTAIPGLITQVRELQGSARGGATPTGLDLPAPPESVANVGPAASAPSGATNTPGASGQPAKGQADPRVREILAGSDLKYSVNPDGNYKIIFDVGSGRTQILFVESNVETLGGLEIREVWSPIGQTAEGSFPQTTADRLLRVGGALKVGAVEVVTVDGKPTAYFSAKVPADLNAEQLMKVINAVATTADENENSLFGGDTY